MKIEAIAAAKGLHPEYLVRMSHKEVMALGAVDFLAGEYLSLAHHIERIDTAMTGLRYTADRINAALILEAKGKP